MLFRSTLGGALDLVACDTTCEQRIRGKNVPENLRILALEPGQELGNVRQLLLGIDGRNELVRAVSVDSLGNETVYTFADIEHGVPLANALFEFDLPAGVEVVRVR